MVARVRDVLLVVVLVVMAAEVVVGHVRDVPLVVLVGQFGGVVVCLVVQLAGDVLDLLVVVAAEQLSVLVLVPGGRAVVGHVLSSGSRRSVGGQTVTAKTAAEMMS